MINLLWCFMLYLTELCQLITFQIFLKYDYLFKKYVEENSIKKNCLMSNGLMNIYWFLSINLFLWSLIKTKYILIFVVLFWLFGFWIKFILLFYWLINIEINKLKISVTFQAQIPHRLDISTGAISRLSGAFHHNRLNSRISFALL